MDSDEECVMSKASTSSRASTGAKRPKKKKKAEDPELAYLRDLLEQEKAEHQAEEDHLAKELDETKKALEAHKVLNTSLNQVQSNLIKEHVKEKTDLDKQIKSYEGELRSLKNQIASLTKPDDTVIQLNTKLTAIIAENNQLRKDLAETLAAKAAAEDTKITRLEAMINQLNSKVMTLDTENAKLRRDLAAAQATRENPPDQARENPTGRTARENPSQAAPTPGAPAPTTKKRSRITVPAIVLHNPEDWTQVKTKVSEKNIKIRKSKLTKDGIAIMPESTEDHKNLTSQLLENKKHFHTYALNGEKPIRAVLRGLPLCLQTEDIMQDLCEKGFNPTKISRMIHPRTKAPMPLVLVQVPPNEDNILQIKVCCHLSIRAEEQKPRSQPGQCHNCQGFGHAQNRCSAPPKCVKCGGDHASRSCEKPREEPARCLHCSGPHPASYRGCPKAPRRVPRSTPPTTEAPAAPVRQVPPYRKQHISYAEAARPKRADAPVGPPQQLASAPNWQPANPQQWGSLREQFEAMKQLFDRYFSMFQIPQQEAMDQDLANTTTTQLS